MAKKTTKKKAPPKNGRYHKQSKAAVKNVLTKGPIRKKAPRERALPGMEDARIQELDDVAQSISECRATMNEARTDEKGYEQTALRLMQKHNKQSWAHAGVTLVRVPGEEKLSVRTSKSNATAQTEPDEDADIEAMDAGDGLDAEI